MLFSESVAAALMKMPNSQNIQVKMIFKKTEKSSKHWRIWEQHMFGILAWKIKLKTIIKVFDQLILSALPWFLDQNDFLQCHAKSVWHDEPFTDCFWINESTLTSTSSIQILLNSNEQVLYWVSQLANATTSNHTTKNKCAVVLTH